MELVKQGLMSTVRLYRAAGADFPKSELKPLCSVVWYCLRGRYRCYTLTHEGEARGYAMLFLPGDGGEKLIDYLAVFKKDRGRGYGSELLRLLREREGPTVLESEDPDFSHGDADRAVREKRLAFYFRAGYTVRPFKVKLFGVEFLILSNGGALSRRGLEGIYEAMLPAAVRRRQLVLTEDAEDGRQAAPSGRHFGETD